MTAAETFITEYGGRLEDAIETLIGKAYLKQIEGTPSNVSQYDVEYDQFRHVIDTHNNPAHALRFLIDNVELWIKSNPGDAIVWRIRPVLTPVEDDNRVKLRFRAHALKDIPECLP